MIYILLFGAFVAVAYFFAKSQEHSRNLSSSKAELDACRTKLTQLEGTNASLNDEISALSKFKPILDAEAHARDILSKAREEMSKAEIESTQAKQKAKADAEKITEGARQELRDLRERAAVIITEANGNAQNLISNAENEAKKIAGDAYEALKKADALEKTAKAMKNIIEGYGDQYIIPTHSLLDQLGEDYSHTDAGEQLKSARESMRSMIKNKSAATCDYVEENRKQTAIEFVLDAFNGKVDTILASVKDDNFGKLEQKIKDAFETVNHNGTAFRDARITELYLQNRLSELKWACTVQAIKEKEKEEQRRIREQIREEEKAARDYERAMKEAEKEEQTLAKAMDKVKKDLESASEQQKLQYEQKLLDLQQKLSEAEEKNKRALSMAQQTKTGHVYIISNLGSFGEDVYKIGMTRRLDPMDRVWELGDASVPFDFDVHAMILSEDAPALEKMLHEKFRERQINKVNPRKEFFDVGLIEIKAEIDRLKINAHWTLISEAKEFRESLALEQKQDAVKKTG